MVLNKKITLAILALIVLAGAGILFARLGNKQGRIFNPEAGKPADEFALWQTYFGMKKGFDIRIPPSWSKNYDHDGANLGHKDRFWRDQAGEVEFLGSATATSTAKFSVLIKDSDLTLDDFAGTIQMGPAENSVISGLQVRKNRGEDTEKVLIQNGRRFFYLTFSAPKEIFSKDIVVWEKILGTFSVPKAE